MNRNGYTEKEIDGWMNLWMDEHIYSEMDGHSSRDVEAEAEASRSGSLSMEVEGEVEF